MLYIFGDIHVGDDRSDENLNTLFKIIEKIDKKHTIILNGDCFDFIRCEEMDQRHFKFLDLINSFFNVFYVVGNHDFNAREKLKNRNLMLVDELSFKINNKRIKILHGHQVDFFAKCWPIISRCVISINSLIYKTTGFDVERWIKKNKFFQKMFFNKQIEKLTSMYSKDYDILVSGHVHQLCFKEGWLKKSKKSFVYANAGDWIDNLGYVVIDDGNVSLVKIRE